MRSGLVFGFVLVTALASAQAPAPRGKDTGDAAIVKISAAYVKAALASDAKAVAALYTEDAIEMPPNRPAVKGRAAIEQYYVKEFADPTAKLTAFTLDHIESVSSGDAGFDVGTYRQTVMLKDGKTVSESGKYTVILKKTGGDWKVAYAIYNSDQPPPMPPPAPKS